MITKFESQNTFKRAIIVVKDNENKQWNYVVESVIYGWFPSFGAGTWAEKYDVNEDGDAQGELEFTRYIFEAKTPLAVRQQAAKRLQQIRSQFEDSDYTYNEKLWY